MAARETVADGAFTSAHGFEFTGDVPAFGLRARASRLPLDITSGSVIVPDSRDAVGHWPAITDKRAEVTIVLTDEDRHVVTVGSMARFLVDSTDLRIVAEYAPQLPPIIQTTTLMSSPLALCMARRGLLPIHAAAVEVGGRAALLAAPGTGGKTTLAAAFHTVGHRALSDDLVGVDPSGMVEPAVALLRLRLDAAEALESRMVDVSLCAEEVGKRFYEVDEHRRGDGAPVSAAAVVFLQWSEDGKVSVEEVPPSAALQQLWRLTFYLTTDPGPAEVFERLARLVDRIPSFVVRRPRDFSRLDEGVDRISAVIRES